MAHHDYFWKNSNGILYNFFKAWHEFLIEEAGNTLELIIVDEMARSFEEKYIFFEEVKNIYASKNMYSLEKGYIISEEDMLTDLIRRLKCEHKEKYNFDLLWSRIHTLKKPTLHKFFWSLRNILHNKEVKITDPKDTELKWVRHSEKALMSCCKYTTNLSFDLFMSEKLFQKFVNTTKKCFFKTITVKLYDNNIHDNINLQQRIEAIASIINKTTTVIFCSKTLAVITKKIPDTSIDKLFQPICKRTKNLALRANDLSFELKGIDLIKHDLRNFFKKINLYILNPLYIPDTTDIARIKYIEKVLNLCPNLKKIIIDTHGNYTLYWKYLSNIAQLALTKGIDIKIKNPGIMTRFTFLYIEEVTDGIIDDTIASIKEFFDSILSYNNDTRAINGRFDLSEMRLDLFGKRWSAKLTVKDFITKIKELFNDFNTRCNELKKNVETNEKQISYN
jgi:hypothetical protein